VRDEQLGPPAHWQLPASQALPMRALHSRPPQVQVPLGEHSGLSGLVHSESSSPPPSVPSLQEQKATPFCSTQRPDGQRTPQPPQWSGSLPVSTHTPSQQRRPSGGAARPRAVHRRALRL
jgi:hypothetical protein